MVTGIGGMEDYLSTPMDFVNIFAHLKMVSLPLLVIVGKESNTTMALTVESVKQVSRLKKFRNYIIYMV